MENPSNRQTNELPAVKWLGQGAAGVWPGPCSLSLRYTAHWCELRKKGKKEPRWKQINDGFLGICVCFHLSLCLWCLSVYALVHFRTPLRRRLPPLWRWASPEEPGCWVPMVSSTGAVWYGVVLKYEKMPFLGRKAKNPQYCQYISVCLSCVYGFVIS